jgi:phytol kinase
MLSLLTLVLGLAGVCLLVVVGEYLRRVHLFHAEVTRKFIHITVATYVATWPFFMEWKQIQLISLLMFIGILTSRYLHLFRAIHGIKRRTWGELFFAMSIGIAAVLSPSTWAFTAAMLVMGAADGFAALVGTLLDKTHRYKVFGHVKSYEGTITFFVVSILILLVTAAFGHFPQGFTGLLWLALLATVFENIAVAGTDNLFVPLLVVILLSS